MSIPNGSCVCIKCHTRKDNTEFQYNKRYLKPNGEFVRKDATCKACKYTEKKVLYYLKKNYTKPAIGTPCSCCGRKMMSKKDDVNNPQTETYKMVLDHDHDTGKFRGWICSHCNQAIGHANESLETLKNMVKYLQVSAAVSLAKASEKNATDNINSTTADSYEVKKDFTNHAKYGII